MADDFSVSLDKETMDALLDELSAPDFLAAPHERIGAQFTAYMAKYPPERPGQSYRRTKTLGRTWTHVVQKSLLGVSTIVGNVTPYAPDTQSIERQADIHKGRWQTDQDAINDLAPWAVEQVIKYIDEMVNGHA